MPKYSYTQLKHAWAEEHRAWKEAVEMGFPRSSHLNERFLYRMGLISHQTFLIITDASAHHDSRWWRAGTGRWFKRQLSKARRRVARGTGKERSQAGWESECNWKGT